MKNNDKILDEDIAKYLMEFIGEEVVREKQYEILKIRMLDYLTKITNLFKNEKYSELRKLGFDSCAGDGYGDDNTCLDFSKVFNVEKEVVDFGEAISWLERLKNKDYIKVI